jgi:hypothetical protein
VRSEAASGGDGDLNLGPKGRQGREDSEATGNSVVGGGEHDLPRAARLQPPRELVATPVLASSCAAAAAIRACGCVAWSGRSARQDLTRGAGSTCLCVVREEVRPRGHCGSTGSQPSHFAFFFGSIRIEPRAGSTLLRALVQNY